ncbi:uracil-DNA glycosylase [Swingsia samuiensis]|uniref:Uracil-DNA glycosylase n=1 Tax=Swingsia samuiensis TaxID=1293412 RepID=A0A4Y6UJL7_9PROT|nr:uracil-DNA glycosylase [Swingsia samuiensis]QDH16557.1 uracil-DNA glycosylase [Swingsia samuiensis]
MTLQSILSRTEILAALQVQCEWGVDEVLQEDVLNCLEIVTQPLPQRPVAPVYLKPQEKVTSPSVGEIEQAQDIAGLMRAGEALDELFLARTATHRLMPHLVENAPFMLIGEVPDADEDRSGHLFAGKAGGILDRMLASIDVKRSQISIVPALPWRPPGGRSVTAQEMMACRPFLLKIIEICQPAFVVTMGVTPLRMLTEQTAMLSRVRGKWCDISNNDKHASIRLLPMRHPLQLAASPSARRNAWQDMLILRQELSKTK